MKAIDHLREKLKEIHPDSIPGTTRLTLSTDQIDLFFGKIVIPAFKQIEEELKGFPLRVFIRCFSASAQLMINDANSSFKFRLEIDNKISLLSITFHYRSKAAIARADNPSFAEWSEGFIKHTCETMELDDYKKITEEHLIETFTEYYFRREELAADIIARSKAAEAKKFARELEESKRLRMEEI